MPAGLYARLCHAFLVVVLLVVDYDAACVHATRLLGYITGLVAIAYFRSLFHSI